MTPRALAPDTMPLLKPLSCQAMAAASEGETPCAAAMLWMSAAVNRCCVGSGAAFGTTVCVGAGVLAAAGAGAPLGSLITVPVSSTPAGSSPFIAAIALTDTPDWRARLPSVSPGRTLYAPCGAGAPAAGALAVAGDAPPASRSVEPATSTPAGSRPLAAASDCTETPARDASAVSVSPDWTV